MREDDFPTIRPGPATPWAGKRRRRPQGPRSGILGPRGLLLPLTLSAGLLAGCSRDASTPSVPALDGAAKERAAAISRPAWLRERLPEHTVAYLRVPSMLGWLSAPNGRALDPALASEAHVRAIGQLREAVRGDKLIGDSGLAPMLGLLLSDLSSPVEIAVVDGSDIANPASGFFATMRLDTADVAALNARIAALSKTAPLLKAPLDADGRGELANNGFVRFDAAARRLFVHAGMTASADGLDALIRQTAQMRPAEMAASEREIDASGQGLFLWVKLKGINGMAGAYLRPDARNALARDLVQKSESLAAGWGTVDGHGRLQLRLHAPQAKLLAHFGAGAAPPPLRTAGKPQWAMTLHLPDQRQWQDFIDALDADFGAGTRAGFDKARSELAAKFGVDPVDLLRQTGPALVGFEDEAGSYTALEVRDRKALYATIDQIGAKHGWRHETLRVGGADVHHLRIPGANPEAGANATDDPKVSAWGRVRGHLGSHLYWTEDGDWLVFGSVPQALADRAAAAPGMRFADWLASQGYDAAVSVAGVTATTRNVQRTSYYAYLGGLRMAADLLGADVDLARLPSASELRLPAAGATGIALQATPDFLGLNLHYDATPLDAVVGGGNSTATIAAAAIVAAIALPAYQDYVARAQVAGVLAAADPLETYVAEHVIARGAFPEAFDDDALEDGAFADAAKYLDNFWIDDGSIVLQFGDEAASSLHGKQLVLSPYRLGKDIVWRCGNAAIADAARPMSRPADATTMPDRLLPAACR